LQVSDAVDLDELFGKADGQPVRIGGSRVYRSYLIDIGHRSVAAELAVSEVAVEPVQGVCLQIDSGQIEINGDKGPGMVLWMDTAPRNLSFVVSGMDDSKLRVWNCWRGKFGQRDAWFGNAAMKVDAGEPGRYSFKCSDGQRDLDFANLAFELELAN
jgi:hypothetical protein